MARIPFPPVPKRPVPAAIDRVLWRAGFGPTAADRRVWSKRGLGPAIDALVAPKGPAFSGRQMKWLDDGKPRSIDVSEHGENLWAQEVLWWLDKMVRTRRPLVERMTLNLHDHFATSMAKVGSRTAMVNQNELIRRHALGSFDALCRGMTRDPAMQQWLDLVNSNPRHPNENYAREFMELFTIGLTYDQRDVREVARAFTGFRFDWNTKRYWYDPAKHDDGIKTILGKTGRWGVDDAIRICLDDPRHPRFFCQKMWRYFVPRDPSPARLRQLIAVYTASHRNLGALCKAILRSPEVYASLDEPDMVKPPVVHLVGALRATGARALQGSFRWQLDQMGQQPFFPPDVDGWEGGEAYLNTSALKSRFEAMGSVLQLHPLREKSIPVTQKPLDTLEIARRETGGPWESRATRTQLARLAASYKPQWRGDEHFVLERRLVLRHLLLAGPDSLVH